MRELAKTTVTSRLLLLDPDPVRREDVTMGQSPDSLTPAQIREHLLMTEVRLFRDLALGRRA